MRRSLLAISAGVLGCALLLSQAHADVYAWVDASGALTFSDLPPPPGVRVVNVVNEDTPGVSARTAPAPARQPDRQAEDRALSERVRQLERQVEIAGYQPPPPAQYSVPPSNSWCNWAWADCWWLQTHASYPVGFDGGVGAIVVAPSRGFRHFRRSHGVVRGGAVVRHR